MPIQEVVRLPKAFPVRTIAENNFARAKRPAHKAHSVGQISGRSPGCLYWVTSGSLQHGIMPKPHALHR